MENEHNCIAVCTFFDTTLLWNWNALDIASKLISLFKIYTFKWLFFFSPFLPLGFYFFFFFKLEVNYFTTLHWLCHTSTWIHHRYTHVPHSEPLSLLPPPTIPLGRLSAPAPSILYPASNLDWQFASYMILYMFQCHSLKSSHPLPLLQSPKDCSI